MAMGKKSKKPKPTVNVNCQLVISLKCPFLPSSCIDFLTDVVFCAGLLDVAAGVFLIFLATNMLEAIQAVEEMYFMLPVLEKAHLDVKELLSEYEVSWEDLLHSFYFIMLVFKGSFVLVMAVAFLLIVLSALLFIGLGKNSPGFCAVWISFNWILLLISGALLIIEFYINYFDFDITIWLLLNTYVFFRLGVIFASRKVLQNFVEKSESDV